MPGASLVILLTGYLATKPILVPLNINCSYMGRKFFMVKLTANSIHFKTIS